MSDTRRARVITIMHQVVDLLGAMGIPDSKQFSAAHKAAHWKAIDRTARKWEKTFSAGARRAFEKDKREIFALLRQTQKKALREKATVNWTYFMESVSEYLLESGENWRSVFVPLIKGVITDQAKRWSLALGLAFDVENLFARDWFNQYTLTFANPITATSEREIAALLNQGMTEGWSIPQTQDHLETLFEQWMTGDVVPEDWEFAEQRLPPYRAETIARTETMRASNSGSTEIFR